MREFVDSLRRLYKEKALITAEKIMEFAIKEMITQEEYDYIVAE